MGSTELKKLLNDSDNLYTENGLFTKEEKELTLTWKDLTVTYKKKISRGMFRKSHFSDVKILREVNGQASSGKLMGILGPSGAGKTTLLASISMRVKGNFTGTLLLNGKVATKKILVNISGFVPQCDIGFEALTVMEHMEFMAKMKMDRNMKAESRRTRIRELLQQFGLVSCKHTALSKLSGGERKRLSLIVQLINDPLILFCDEPTTGLDSWTAISVVKQLRSLATSGKIVICSIHQPASGIFDLLHEVTLMSDGEIAFYGPTRNATAFFISQGFEFPKNYNEAEYLVSVLSNNNSVRQVCDTWSQHHQRTKAYFDDTLLASYHSVSNESSHSSTDSEWTRYFSIKRPGKLTQFYWLAWRGLLTTKRQNKPIIAENISLLILAIIISVPYINMNGMVNQAFIQNIQGFMYVMTSEIYFTKVYAVVHTFPPEIAVFLREVADGIYTPGPYYLSKTLLLIPLSIIGPLLYTVVILWTVKLDAGINNFFMFSLPLIFAANSANAFGAWLSSTFESIEVASVFSAVYDFLSYVSAGMYVNLSNQPIYLAWLRYISIFYYSTEAISILQWKNVTNIACDNRPGLPCITNGNQVLDAYSYNSNDYRWDLIGMAVIYLVFHVLGFIALIVRSKRKPVY